MKTTFTLLGRLSRAARRHRVAAFASALLVLIGAQAQAATIAQWTYETSAPTTSGPIAPEIGSGSAKGGHAGAATYSSPVGNFSTKSYSANGWNIGDYWQFQVDTTNYEDIMIDWEQASSNTGPRDYQFSYSTDGTTFTPLGSVYAVLANAAPNPLWMMAGPYAAGYHRTVDLSSIAAVEHTSTVYLRMAVTSGVSANGGTLNTSAGTNRLDDVVISGTPASVPEPHSLALAGIGAIGVAMMALRRRSIL